MRQRDPTGVENRSKHGEQHNEANDAKRSKERFAVHGAELLLFELDLAKTAEPITNIPNSNLRISENKRAKRSTFGANTPQSNRARTEPARGIRGSCQAIPLAGRDFHRSQQFLHQRA